MLEQPIFSVDNLPIRPPEKLYGRRSELQRLQEYIKEGQVVWLQGISGSGRRSLAAKVAAERVSKSGGVLWFHVYYDNLLTLAGRFSRAYGVSALSTDDIASRLEIVQALLEENNPLVILDGQISPVVVQQFIKEFRPFSLPVIIAGSPYKPGPWEQLTLRTLRDKDSEAIYRKHSKVSPETTRSALLAPLLNYVEGHALSLQVAGIQVQENTMATSHFTSLLPQTAPGPQNRALGIYATAYQQLDSGIQGLMLLCGALFVDRVGLRLLQSITGTDEKVLEPYLQSIALRGFCRVIQQPGQPVVYRFYDLARIFARQMLKARKQLDTMYTHILKGIQHFIEIYTENTTEEDYDVLALEMDHILGAAQFATRMQDRETVKTIFKLLGKHGTRNVIHVRGYQAFYERLGHLLAGKPANYDQELARIVKPEGEVIADSRLIKGTGRPALSTENKPRAHLAAEQLMGMSREALQNALNEAMGAQDIEDAARLSYALGEWYTEHNQASSALSNYQESAELYAKVDDQTGQLDALHQLVTTSLQLNRPSEAIEHLQQALPLASVTDNQKLHGQLLSLMADAQAATHQVDNALETYTQAVDILQKADDPVNMGLALGKKAALLMDISRLEQATVILAQAIDLFEKAGRSDLQGRALGNLGTAFGRLGRLKEAGQRHMLALKIARESTDIEEERYQLMNLAFVSEAEGHLDWAIHYSRQALYLALVASDREAVGQIAFTTGRLLLTEVETLAQSIVLLQHSVDIAALDDSVRLLNRAQKRYERLQASGHSIPPAENDLLRYTQSAYEGREQP